MCGIVGLYLKNPALESQLGKLFEPMLEAMTGRGPDSAGFAIYGDEVQDGWVGHVIPFDLVQATILKDEGNDVKNKRDELDNVSSGYEEILESMKNKIILVGHDCPAFII